MNQTYTLTLTENCNLACIYCYEHNRNGRSMSLNTAKDILGKAFRSIGKNDRLTIDFFGGEPFLEYEKIKEIVEYVNEKATTGCFTSKYQFFATTNGTLIHGEVQEWLRKHKNFTLGLSLDGNKYMHDVNRSNSFNKIDLDFFLTMYPKQPVKMTISDKTLLHLAEGVIYCHKKGFEISCNLAYGIDWTNSVYAAQLEQQLDQLILFYLDHPDIKPCSLLNRKLAIVGISKPKTTVHRWCGAGTAMHTFDCDGTYYPCQFFMPISCGEEKSENSKAIPFFEEIPLLLLDEKCRDCIISATCPTCYGSNYFESGNIYHKNDAQCALEKITLYENACLLIKRWEIGQLTYMADDQLVASLIGAKRIIEQFSP